MVRSEGSRWALWIAPFFGGGVGLYFFLPIEPPLWVGGGAAAFFFASFLLVNRKIPSLTAPILLALAISGGLFAGGLRTQQVAAPVLHKPLGPITLLGMVADLEETEKGWRLVLEDLSPAAFRQNPVPIRVRITVRNRDEVQVGARIRVRAKLLPPPEPSYPGGYDFARRAWFEQLGAVGFAYGTPEVISVPKAGGKAEAPQDGIRHRLAADLQRTVGQEHPGQGAVAAALVTGMRGAIAADLQDAYRGSGLAHLLAISGLHMALAGGIFFALIRTGVALVPALALRLNGKKIAAVGALVGMSAYLALSGFGIPAQRAFIMGAIVFGAILVDRNAISLRTLSFAAIVILAVQPEALTGASFQMSFAAVTALVALYEQLSPRWSAWRRTLRAATDRPSWHHRVLRSTLSLLAYPCGVILTSVIAGLATLPIAAFHFHQIALYGVAANACAVPWVSLVVMPLLILTTALSAFGVAHWTAPVLGQALQVVEHIAVAVSSWPGAVVQVPPLSVLMLGLIVSAFLWLLLWRQRWRWWGLVGVPLVGLWVCGPDVADLSEALRMPSLAKLSIAEAPPDFIVSASGQLVAYRDGRDLFFSPGRNEGYGRSMWNEWWGRTARPTPWQEKPGSHEETAAESAAPIGPFCDPLGCRWTVEQEPDHPLGPISVSWVLHPAAMADDCARSRVLLSPLTMPTAGCRASVVIDYPALQRDGAHALWIGRGEPVRVLSVRQARGERPWVR